MSYIFDSIVNKQEADTLKEMIFRRVRERSNSMNEEVQTEVMDMARDSFVSSNNPFSQIVEKTNVQPESNPKELVQKGVDNENIGFAMPQKQPKAFNQSHLINEQVANAEIKNNMREARAGLSNNKSFMGALNFLNSQAAISLIKTRSDKFEMIV